MNIRTAKDKICGFCTFLVLFHALQKSLSGKKIEKNPYRKIIETGINKEDSRYNFERLPQIRNIDYFNLPDWKINE